MHSKPRQQANCSFKNEKVKGELRGRARNRNTGTSNRRPTLILQNSQCALTVTSAEQRERERAREGGEGCMACHSSLPHTQLQWKQVAVCPLRSCDGDPKPASREGGQCPGALFPLLSWYLSSCTLLRSPHCCEVCQTFKRLSTQKWERERLDGKF